MILKILPPEKAKKKAQERLKEWKKGKQREESKRRLAIQKTKTKQKTIPTSEKEKLNNDLIKAARRGNLRKVKELIESGVDVNAKHKWGWTPLMFAARYKHAETGEYLLQKGADVTVCSVNKGNAHTLAVQQDLYGLARQLLEKGADSDVPNEFGTPLRHCIKAGNVEYAELLIKKGANVNSIGGGNNFSVLTYSCQKGEIEIVRLLLRHGADVNVKNRIEGTPLENAINRRYIKIVELLVDNGAEIDARAIGIANERGFGDIEEFLKKHIAK
jgi:ankyrin repeat protein